MAELCLTLEECAEDTGNCFTSDTTLQFLPGNHILNMTGFVEIWNVSNMALVGVDSYTPGFKGLPEPVSRIVCNGSELWNSGLAIINATNLRIESLSFSKCGTYTELLDDELLNVRGKSVFKMGVGLKAAVFMVSIHALVIVNITVEKSFGYGLLGLNVLGGAVYGASFTENNLYTYHDSNCFMLAGDYCDTFRCIGGNFLLVFEDYSSMDCLDTTYKFEIWNSSFLHGVSVCDMITGSLQAAGGLGVLFGQSSFGAEVDIHDVHIEGNTAPRGGNVHVEFFNYVNGSSVILQRAYIGYGNAEYPIPYNAGGGIYLRYGILHWSRRWFSPMCAYDKVEATQWNALRMSECEISNGRANIGTGIDIIIVGTDTPQHSLTIHIEKSLVSNNIGLNGVAVYIAEYQTSSFVNPTHIIFTDTNFTNNQFGIDDEDFFYKYLDTTLLGTVCTISMAHFIFSNCTFYHNQLTGLAAWGSNIIFSGNNSFVSNRGFSGGGMGLSKSIIYLVPHTHINFINNSALQRGGGIYVDSSSFEIISPCFFQVYDRTFSTEPAISITFRNNFARESGKSLYGGEIDSCFMAALSSYIDSSSSEVADLIFDFDNSSEPDSVSSNPFLICICTTSSDYDCGIKNYSINTYSGKPFQISVVAVGQRNGTAPAYVSAMIAFANGKKGLLGKRQAIQEVSQYCTLVEYSVFSNPSIEYIHLRVTNTGMYSYRNITTLDITLHPCPPGFSNSLSLGCNCDPLLLKHGIHDCDISSQSILKKGDLWIGLYLLTDSSEALIVHMYCPLDYCKAEEMNITLDDLDVQCAFEHSGVLCGACKPGLSLSLGSSQCLECFNSYLGFVALFAGLGILLVLILLLFNLTVAVGTLNGLVFYANIIKMNHSIFFSSISSTLYGRFLSVFIAWLNLDFGITVCFANGMNAYIRMWLQFVFPAYIWALVGLIIIASRYSVTLSNHLATNAVPVLATLFLLSYTKILRTITAALSFTFLNLPDETREAVWLYDGNILYFKGKHIQLAIFAIMVFLLTAIPYTFLLMFGQLLQAVSNHRAFQWVNKLMPFFDAHHAPYKDKHRYWTGLLLLIRIAILVTTSVNFAGKSDINLVVIGCIIVFILSLSLSFGGIYKRWYLTVLESFFLFNLGTLVILLLYFKQADEGLAVKISVGVAFATFIGIIALHLTWKIHLWEFIKPQLEKLATAWCIQNRNAENDEPQNLNTRYQSFPMTVHEALREPLIDDTTL